MTISAQIRDELEEALVRDLLGPADGLEEIVDAVSVRDRYLVGTLAPRGQSATVEEAEEVAADDEDGEEGGDDKPLPAAPGMMTPSSIGLTFAVALDASALRVSASWGRYERVSVEDDAYRDRNGRLRRVWRRVPCAGTSEPVLLCDGQIAPWPPCPECPDVVVQGLARRRSDRWLVTLFLVNNQPEPESLRDQAWLFQPELVVEAPDGAPIFEEKPLPTRVNDPEEAALEMLYRHEVEFAIGHGVGVQANLAPARRDRAVALRTSVIPTYDVPRTVAPTVQDYPSLAGLTLDMKALAEVEGPFAPHLQPIVGAYGEWIQRQEARIAAGESGLAEHRAAARDAMRKCRRALDRVAAGISLLDSDPRAAAAFRFANRAMYLQRVHSALAVQARRGESTDLAEIDVPEGRTWYVFQLAFLLINLPGLTDLGHADRAVPLDDPEAAMGAATADLLWFPTGGGKTEAYLGLAAYAMAMRRLQGTVAGRSGAEGIAVLMRYTLRLLTLQQFQRASALICACEAIRRENPDVWGAAPFRIGLWVGRRTTPNTTDASEQAIRQLRQGAELSEGTPYQLTNCPWCGTEIHKGRDLDVEPFAEGSGRTIIYCGDQLGRCEFSRRRSPGEGIPALVVDEEIYRLLPSLLIATVDKFAQLPWQGETAMLFGQVGGRCERHGFRSPDLKDSNSHPKKNDLPKAKTVAAACLRPPDLIIQDELHLISGPLGTLVGLYEAAVDRLASWEVDGSLVRPKVVASTATIRRAANQVHGLFLRNVEVFPPQGLDAGDNFFSLQRPISSEHPGRRYLGLCAPGIRHKSGLTRAYLALLAGAQQLFAEHGVAADPWMTLVGYFNSLRELGGMRRVVDDTIDSRLRTLDRHGLAVRKLGFYGVSELTSRRSATDIPEILDRLETSFEPPAEAGAPRRSSSRSPIDVLLATNMVSVGVDVRRLGLMVVAGQPKATAEYIQATSRVGRQHPGLVVTVYNWARPRDLSHYERFCHYHATFYKHVEALSVTPFSPRALDRGLGAVLVSVVRSLDLELNGNHGAGAVVQGHHHFQEAVRRLAARAAEIGGPEAEALTRQTLAALQDEWVSHAEHATSAAKLGYETKRDGLTIGLLKPPGLGRWESFTCLNSLRDVEPSVSLILRDVGRDIGGIAAERPWRYQQPPLPAEQAAVDEDGNGEEDEA